MLAHGLFEVRTNILSIRQNLYSFLANLLLPSNLFDKLYFTIKICELNFRLTEKSQTHQAREKLGIENYVFT